LLRMEAASTSSAAAAATAADAAMEEERRHVKERATAAAPSVAFTLTAASLPLPIPLPLPLLLPLPDRPPFSSESPTGFEIALPARVSRDAAYKFKIQRTTIPLGDAYVVTDFFCQGMSFGDAVWLAQLSRPATRRPSIARASTRCFRASAAGAERRLAREPAVDERRGAGRRHRQVLRRVRAHRGPQGRARAPAPPRQGDAAAPGRRPLRARRGVRGGRPRRRPAQRRRRGLRRLATPLCAARQLVRSRSESLERASAARFSLSASSI